MTTIYFPSWWTRDDALWCMTRRWSFAVWRIIVGPVVGPEPMRVSVEVER